MTNTPNITRAVTDCLSPEAPWVTRSPLLELLDTIAAMNDDLSLDDALLIMTFARYIDPTLSGPGAQLRDALRDNTDFDLDAL